MAFSSQPPAPQEVEGAGDRLLGTVPDMVWISEKDFNTNLQSHQDLQLAQHNNAFNFQHEPDASSILSFPYSSFGDIPMSQTGSPFRTAQSQKSNFRQYDTDSLVSGKKQKDNATHGPQPEEKYPGTDWGIQFNAHQFGVSLTE